MWLVDQSQFPHKISITGTLQIKGAFRLETGTTCKQYGGECLQCNSLGQILKILKNKGIPHSNKRKRRTSKPL